MTADLNNPKESSVELNNSETLTSSQVQTSDMIYLVRELQAFISQNPNIFGAADIYNIRFQSPLTLAGMLTAVLIGVVDSDRRPAVHKFVVIVPPGLNAEDCEENVWSGIANTFRLLAEREMEPPEQSWLKRRLQLITASDRRIRSILEIIRVQPERKSIIVAEASSYRDDSIGPYIAAGASSPLRPEDVWVPQLHALATAATKIAQECKLYVALDAYQLSPSRKDLSDLLLSIERCGVMGSSSENSPESILATRVDQWDAWIREGRLGQALRDIERLPARLDSNKPLLRIQVLYKAGHFLEALQAIRQEIAHAPEFDAPMRVKLARIAQGANASRLAVEILSPAIAELNSQEDLESALATAQDAGSTELEKEVVERLAELFPGSPGLRQRLLRILLSSRDYVGAAAMVAEESDGKAEFYSTLARFLSGDDIPDYNRLIALAGRDTSQADAYRMACVNDALSRNLIPQAFELVMPLPSTPAQAERGERLLLRILENILLHKGKSGALPVPMEDFHAAIISLIERLAAKPENQGLRGNLAHLIQPSVAGTMGLALMAFIVLNLASRAPVRLEKRRSLGKADVNWLLERESFLHGAFDWLENEGPIVIGRSKLPESLLTEPADEVVSAITEFLAYAPLESDEDVMAHWKWLALATSVTPHCSNPDYDLPLMRVVASKYASSGRTQIARDLVEQILLNSTDTPRRRRLGWFAMADVYHRCHNYLEAFLATACTLAADDAGDEDQVWHEITGMARLFRDSGLHAHARSAIQKGRLILQRMELLDAYSHRLDTLDLQIRLRTLQIDTSERADLEALLVDVIRNGEAVLKHHDITEPAAALLGQLLRQAREIGATIPAKADGVYAELLKHTKGSYRSLISMMSAVAPSADELFTLIKTNISTRYSDDVGYDMNNAVIAASRALSKDDYISDANNTSFALEILADRGVGVPEWDETPEPAPPPQKIDEVAEIACAISREGLSVVQAGFDSSGRLVRVSSVEGHMETPLREPDNLILAERFTIWSEKYPYAYGIDGDSVNQFYTTTADLRLSSLPPGPVVIVADVRFQPFPPNLLFVDEEFAGRTRPMAMAPSLSWLQAARAKGMIGDGRFCSWISTAVGSTESQTLSMIAQRLDSTFSQYGFIVDNGPTLPAAFAGASLAVITAHGGVHPEGRYFQVVSDEGILRVTARDLANSLRNVGIVILFVCSGGRADKHPGAQTVLGLAKDILDRGCAAVIASPWPLDARVPSHWLPTFLEHWFQGDTLIEANFYANKAVDRYFSHDPALGLAMSILGNPLLRRT